MKKFLALALALVPSLALQPVLQPSTVLNIQTFRKPSKQLPPAALWS